MSARHFRNESKHHNAGSSQQQRLGGRRERRLGGGGRGGGDLVLSLHISLETCQLVLVERVLTLAPVAPGPVVLHASM